MKKISVCTIPLCNLSDFKNKVSKLNKKAEKLGLDIIVLKFGNVETTNNVEHVTIEIYQENEIKINGFQFVAKLEKTSNGKFIIKGNAEHVPTSQKQLYECQHCNTKRQRKIYYILKNIDTNEFLNVGKSCLKDFIGHDNAEQIANFYSCIFDTVEESEKLNGLIKTCNHMALETALKIATYYTKKDGYKKSHEENSTKEQILKCHYGYMSNAELMDDYKQAMKIPNDYITDMINFVMGMENKTDFINNLKVLLSGSIIDCKNIGFLAYIPTMFSQELSRKILVEEKAKKQETLQDMSNFVGNIGEKMTVNVFYEKTLSFDSMYGTMYMYFFKDTNNNVIVWKTSIHEEFNTEKMTIKCKVKEHKEFNKVNQTIVTHLKTA